MKHTPGPWTIDQLCDSNNFIAIIGVKNCQATIETDTAPPVDIYTDDDSKRYDNEQQKYFEIANANAKLIAAAPDLLEACQFALKNLSAKGNVKKDFSGHLAMATLSKAIHKATEQPPDIEPALEKGEKCYTKIQT